MAIKKIIHNDNISENNLVFKNNFHNDKIFSQNNLGIKKISIIDKRISHNDKINSENNLNLRKFSHNDNNISTTSFRNIVYFNNRGNNNISIGKKKDLYFKKYQKNEPLNSVQNLSNKSSKIKFKKLISSQRPSVKSVSKNKLCANLNRYKKEKNQKEKIKKIINNTNIINIYQNNYIDVKKGKKKNDLKEKKNLCLKKLDEKKFNEKIKKKLEENLNSKKEKKSKMLNFLDLQKPKVIIKNYGLLKCLATNTYHGTRKKINEDRICISLNLQKTINKKKLINSHIKNCSILSIFDGHGGTKCCDFLKKNLHKTIFKIFENNFSLINSLKICYKKIDEFFLKNLNCNSGSCAITVIFYNESLFVVNLGDSRAVLSLKKGSYFKEISKDHKPNFLSEFERIKKNKGCIYTTCLSKKKKVLDYFAKDFNTIQDIEKIKKNNKILDFGPWRIFPGGISVSRSFGDGHMKKNKNKLLISEPDIFEVNNLKDSDFLIIGCKFISRWYF